jgi:hypothetical protein
MVRMAWSQALYAPWSGLGLLTDLTLPACAMLVSPTQHAPWGTCCCACCRFMSRFSPSLLPQCQVWLLACGCTDGNGQLVYAGINASLEGR